jgi:hypothetical protein
VDEEAIGDDRGRIQIVVEYEMKNAGLLSSSSSNAGQAMPSSAYQSVENRITAHVDIQRDNTYAIVPVVKVGLTLKLPICHCSPQELFYTTHL